jgi:hypothetical protein
MKMKTTIACLMGVLIAVNVFAQGQVTFNNTPSSAIIMSDTGVAPVGGRVIAGLYFNTDLTAVPDPSLTAPDDGFRLAATTPVTPNPIFAGVYSAGAVEIPGVPEASQVLLQVRAWSVGFDDYNLARADRNPETFIGASNLMGPVTLGGPVTGIPISATSALVQGFTMTPVPEPSTVILGLLGGLGAMVLLRRRK